MVVEAQSNLDSNRLIIKSFDSPFESCCPACCPAKPVLQNLSNRRPNESNACGPLRKASDTPPPTSALQVCTGRPLCWPEAAGRGVSAIRKLHHRCWMQCGRIAFRQPSRINQERSMPHGVIHTANLDQLVVQRQDDGFELLRFDVDWI